MCVWRRACTVFSMVGIKHLCGVFFTVYLSFRNSLSALHGIHSVRDSDYGNARTWCRHQLALRRTNACVAPFCYHVLTYDCIVRRDVVDRMSWTMEPCWSTLTIGSASLTSWPSEWLCVAYGLYVIYVVVTVASLATTAVAISSKNDQMSECEEEKKDSSS